MPGVGALAAGGIISLLVGSVLLLGGAPAYLALSPWVIGTVVATTAAFFLVVLRGIVRTYRRRPTTGVSGLLGATGVARTELKPSGNGMAFVQGELWRARLAGDGAPVEPGARVEVVAVEGLSLVVRRVA
jgi:membrane-bound serine protease (ClpP class)